MTNNVLKVEKMENNLGSRLKYLRKKHNFTQREVGDFLDISQSQLAKVESNDRNLKLTKLLKLCDLFNVSEEYLLYGEGDSDKNKLAFRKENKSIDLETLARMNRIVNNLKFMKDLYKEHYEDD